MAGAYGSQPYHLNVSIVLKSSSLTLRACAGLYRDVLYLYLTIWLETAFSSEQSGN
jgi:hypothetical protein